MQTEARLFPIPVQPAMLHMEGQEPTEVARRVHHSIKATENYLEKFNRVAYLRREKGFSEFEISRTVGISTGATRTFLSIYDEFKGKVLFDIRMEVLPVTHSVKLCNSSIRCEPVDKSELYGRRKIAANAYGLHSFRHTFVSFCANAGVPYSVVASIVGHGNPAMTEHYSHISTETKREAVRAIPSFLPAQTNGEDDVIDEPLSIRRRAIIEALQTADTKKLSEIERILNLS